MQKFRIGPIFTPPSLKRHAAASEPGRRRELGRRGVRSRDRLPDRRANNVIGVNRVGKNDGSDQARRRGLLERVRRRGESASLPGGLPLVSPPYAVLAAIDLNRARSRGRCRSARAAGDSQSSTAQGRRAAGAPRIDGEHGWRDGHQGGLIFIGGGDGYYLRVRDEDGKEVWRDKIPYNASANPMTYRTRVGQAVHRQPTAPGADNPLVPFSVSAK